jgi:hypothetical protein
MTTSSENFMADPRLASDLADTLVQRGYKAMNHAASRDETRQAAAAILYALADLGYTWQAADLERLADRIALSVHRKRS